MACSFTSAKVITHLQILCKTKRDFSCWLLLGSPFQFVCQFFYVGAESLDDFLTEVWSFGKFRLYFFMNGDIALQRFNLGLHFAILEQ